MNRKVTTLYERATQKLEAQVRTMKLPPDFVEHYDMVRTVHKIRAAFCNPKVRRGAVLQKYEQARVAQKRYSAGFCGIASYMWNQMFRMPDGAEIWRLKMIQRGEYNIGDHVWLENRFTGDALDLTFDQFIASCGDYVEIPYNEIGHYVSSDFEFERAYRFARHLGIDLESIVFENALRSLGRD